MNDLNEKDKAVLLDHDYDGIQELDHPLPKWWLATFYICIAFAIGYFAYYIVMSGPKLSDTYQIDAEELKEIRRNYLQSLSQFKPDLYQEYAGSPDMVSYGESLYNNNCRSCHNKGGAGDIGPNLTDEYWLYAEGNPETIFPFIIKGNPLAGMPAWGEYLVEDEIYAVTSYIMSIQGSNPVDAKDPEGDHYPQGDLEE